MKFLSRLLMRMASWLSPQATITSLQSTQYQEPQQDSEMPSIQLYSQLKRDPSFMQNMVLCQTLEREVLAQRLEEAKIDLIVSQLRLLPHRNFGPSLVNDGLEWVATFGEEPKNRVCGRGDCPQAALNAFDAEWLGTKRNE